MLKKIGSWVLALTLIATFFAPLVKAQDRQEVKEEKNASAPTLAYRLDFTLVEVEDGKKINSRNYTLVVRAPGYNKLRIGARLPVATQPGAATFQYVDLGMSIDCKLSAERDGFLPVGTIVEYSGLGLRDQATNQPIVQQMRAELETLVPPGKPTLITGMDDPVSKRRFELEVTATRAK